MNYELAKQLKDAGFPFDFGEEMIFDTSPPQWNVKHYGFTRKPSLSELIEACGDITFTLIRKYNGIFEVFNSNIQSSESWTLMCSGSTPEEAVSLLWLALNKK